MLDLSINNFPNVHLINTGMTAVSRPGLEAAVTKGVYVIMYSMSVDWTSSTLYKNRESNSNQLNNTLYKTLFI